MAVANCPAFHQYLNEYELLRSYFDKGYTYKDIRDFMETKHGISHSEDQLRRKLKILGLKQRGDSVESPLDEVEAAIQVVLKYITTTLECSKREFWYIVLVISQYKFALDSDNPLVLGYNWLKSQQICW